MKRVWNSKANPNAQGTPRDIYNNHLDRFLRAVRRPKNADAKAYFTNNEFELPAGRRTMPFHPREGNNKFGTLSLDHIIPLEEGGNPVDPDNLRWMIQGDNTNINNIAQKYDSVDAIDWGAPEIQTLPETANDLSKLPQ